MMARHALPGRVETILLRPGRRSDVIRPDSAKLSMDGLEGDHGSAGKRAVTLIQSEHLPVIATLLGKGEIDPGLLRRNLVVSGINLLALRHHEVAIGDAILRITGPCPPCSRMEEVLGHGGYSAVRGHGGVYAEVLVPGDIVRGLAVTRRAST